MGKYLKKFQSHTEYNTYITGNDKVLPNVSYCVTEDEVHFNSNIVTLISFTIHRVYHTAEEPITCQAEEGMTWAQWCDSKYNTIGLYVNNEVIANSDSELISYPSQNNDYINYVKPNYTIIEGNKYNLAPEF